MLNTRTGTDKPLVTVVYKCFFWACYLSAL